MHTKAETIKGGKYGVSPQMMAVIQECYDSIPEYEEVLETLDEAHALNE